MTTAFWNSWQLWEKLCFVLAAGIVVVIALGLFKLTYNTWRLRKYAKIRSDTLAYKKEMQHSASVKRGRAKDVPFGVRALEKGVEVEGVWHSRANTPAPSLQGSPILSPIKITPSHHHESSLASPTSTTRNEIRTPGDYLAASAFSDLPHRGGRLYEPRRSSGLRFSSAHVDPERGEALQQLETRHGTSPDPSPTNSSSPDSSPNDSPVEDNLLQPVYHIPFSSSSQASQESNPFLTPIGTHKSTDETIPLSQLNDLVPAEIQNDAANYHSQLFGSADIAYDKAHAQPIRAFDSDKQKRTSQVIRKINSGFEILQPGTFDAARQSNDFGSQWREVKMGEKKGPKKLQKKGKRDSLV